METGRHTHGDMEKKWRHGNETKKMKKKHLLAANWAPVDNTHKKHL
jgi:hypothetical protein